MSMTIDKLKEQLNQCIQQRDQYASAFQQAIGAINLLQEQIKLLMVEEAFAKAEAEKAAQLAAQAEVAPEVEPAE